MGELRTTSCLKDIDEVRAARRCIQILAIESIAISKSIASIIAAITIAIGLTYSHIGIAVVLDRQSCIGWLVSIMIQSGACHRTSTLILTSQGNTAKLNLSLLRVKPAGQTRIYLVIDNAILAHGRTIVGHHAGIRSSAGILSSRRIDRLHAGLLIHLLLRRRIDRLRRGRLCHAKRPISILGFTNSIDILLIHARLSILCLSFSHYHLIRVRVGADIHNMGL